MEKSALRVRANKVGWEACVASEMTAYMCHVSRRACGNDMFVEMCVHVCLHVGNIMLNEIGKIGAYL